MNTQDEVRIVLKAEDQFTTDMKAIAKQARITKKELDQDLLFKLRADAAGFQLALKQAQESLKHATTMENKFKLTMDVHQFDYSFNEAKRKLHNYLDTGNTELTKFQARIQKAKEALFKDWQLDSRLNPIKLDPKDFEESVSKVKMYARDTKKEIDPLLHHKMTINVIEFQKNVERIKSLLSDKNLKIPEKKRINLEVELDRYNSGLTEAKRQLRNYENTGIATMSRLQAKFNNVGTALGGAIKGGLLALAYQAMNTLKQKIKELIVKAKDLAISFESAFAGVKKTIDASAGQFQGLKKELKDLTTQLPLSFEEIAKIAELGGQLGIAKKDIKEFTKIVANLGTSTNLSTEAAATSLARIANVFQLPSSEYEKLGNVIVQLGNNFATTESEIVDFSSYLMASAKTAGFTADEVFAIGATLSSVAINAEAGGSAFSKAISVMNTAVATGDKTIKDFAKVAGLSAEEFAKQWREKPSEAFTKFVEGLGREGAFAIPIIQELLGNNIRLQNGMLATANAGSKLREALEMAHEEYENGNALQTEADKRYETAQSKIAMLDNELNNMSETLGKNLVPAMVWWKELLVDVHGWINNLFGATDVFSEYLGRLTDKITENEKAMKELTQAYREGKITKEEYLESTKNLGEEKVELKRLYDEEQKFLAENQEALKNNQKEIDALAEKKENLNEKLARSKERYEELTEKGFWFSRMADNQKAESNRLEQALSDLADKEKKLIEQKAELESANAKREVSNYSLKDTFDLVTDAMKKLNDFKLNESGTRAEFEKTKQAALDSIDAFEKRLSMIGAHGGNIVSRFINAKMAQYVGKAKQRLAGLQQKAPKEDSSGLNLDLTKSGGSGSSKSRTEALKKELDQQRDIEIKAIQDSLLDEEEKMKKMTEIQEKYDRKKKELEGKTNDELLKEAEEYMEKLKKGREENYKDHQKKADDALKDVKKYTENLDKIKKKFEEIKEKAGDTLRDIKHNMQELDDKHIKDLGARYYDVKKKIRDNERGESGLKWIGENYSIKTLETWRDAGQEKINNIDIDKVIEHLKLKEELLFLEQKTTKEQQEQAKLEAEKSDSQKMVEKYEKEKKALQEKQAIIQAFSSMEGIESDKKLKIEQEKVKYWDKEKEDFVEITDFKNAEYARDLLNQQTKLETEYKAEQKHLNDSKKLVEKHSLEVIDIRKKLTGQQKEELAKREADVRAHVERVKAMMAEINQAKAASNATVNNNQVTNSNNRTTNYNITNITPKSSSFSGVGLK